MCIYVQCVQKPTKSANRKQESDGSKNATHNMVYLYDACDPISDFCHQQLLRKMRRKISWTDGRADRGKTVYLSPPSGSGGIMRWKIIFFHRKLSFSKNSTPSPLPPVKQKTKGSFLQVRACIAQLIYKKVLICFYGRLDLHN